MEEQGTMNKPKTREAQNTLLKYAGDKAELVQRMRDSDRWFRLQVRPGENKPGDPAVKGAWLLNTVLNKHADAMDNLPTVTVLPREESDSGAADLLSEVLPTVMEQSGFEAAWSDAWWQKLKYGTGVWGVFWDPMAAEGRGEISIRKAELQNLYWEKGISDLQDSKEVYYTTLQDRKALEDRYEAIRALAGAPVPGLFTKEGEEGSPEGKLIVVDRYKKVLKNGRTLLHYCKFVGDVVLFDSEEDERYKDRGFYDHGLYPFVMDTLFPVEDSPAGFGYVDICKGPQKYIDALDSVILKHAAMGARPRFFLRGDGKINEQEFADWSRDFVHYMGSGSPREDITPVEVPPLSELYVAVRNLKVEELKETSGNRNVQQGGADSGVTAASAITALQEAGGKLSRDMIRAGYRAVRQVANLTLELMRQFYDEERYFRITEPNGSCRFAAVSGAALGRGETSLEFGVELKKRVPVFDLVISAEKSSPITAEALNERAKQLFTLGFFRPENAKEALAALSMMRFEGIERVRQQILQGMGEAV